MISGPLLDHIVIPIEFPAMPQETFLKQADGKTNRDTQAHAVEARHRAL